MHSPGLPMQVTSCLLKELESCSRNRIWQARPTRESLHALERRSDVTFWINQRHSTYEEILAAAFDRSIVSGPFTSVYPRYGHADAATTLAQLDATGYIVLDLETSGISQKKHEVIELAIVDNSGEILFESLLRPHSGHTIEGAASAVNAITSEMLADAPTLADTWPELREILTSAHLVTYNASFDIP